MQCIALRLKTFAKLTKFSTMFLSLIGLVKKILQPLSSYGQFFYGNLTTFECSVHLSQLVAQSKYGINRKHCILSSSLSFRSLFFVLQNVSQIWADINFFFSSLLGPTYLVRGYNQSKNPRCFILIFPALLSGFSSQPLFKQGEFLNCFFLFRNSPTPLMTRCPPI